MGEEAFELRPFISLYVEPDTLTSAGDLILWDIAQFLKINTPINNDAGEPGREVAVGHKRRGSCRLAGPLDLLDFEDVKCLAYAAQPETFFDRLWRSLGWGAAGSGGRQDRLTYFPAGTRCRRRGTGRDCAGLGLPVGTV